MTWTSHTSPRSVRKAVRVRCLQYFWWIMTLKSCTRFLLLDLWFEINKKVPSYSDTTVFTLLMVTLKSHQNHSSNNIVSKLHVCRFECQDKMGINQIKYIPFLFWHNFYHPFYVEVSSHQNHNSNIKVSKSNA